MTEPVVRTIHHFEDEPEDVRWLPGTLLTVYWRRHSSWIIEEGRLNELNNRLTTFQLHTPSGQWVIEHRIYQSPQEFAENFGEHAKPGDIVLVDLLDASQQLPVGLEIYKGAVALLGESAVYFLTAFPDQVKAHLSTVDSMHVLGKPIEVNELTKLLYEKLKIA